MSDSRPRPLALLGLAVLGLAALLPKASADQLDPPPYYAIRDVTVRTGTGETLENATVVIADGLIDAVGHDVDVPGDAWVIDGTGLVLYPGLIDTMSLVGQTREEAPQPGGSGPPGRPGGPPRPVIRGPGDRPKTTPWVRAADRLTTEDVRIETWREAGFTSVVAAPGERFFAGQAALVNLGGHDVHDMVVATPVAHRLHYGGPGSFRDFPGSLMGHLSYVKQVFSDARHQAQALAIYAESPAGRTRPAYDRTLAPIQEAVSADLPFLVPGHLGREIDRALALAQEYGLKTILYGGQGAYERLAELENRSIPVLVSLDWPKKARDRDPEADTPLRTHYHRRMAPRTPMLLHERGIAFAFYSDELSSPSKFMEGVRKAVDAGLSSEAALEALTLGAARIFGVDDRLGSIRAGKIANLVLATEAPWAEDAEIRAVFVDGRKYSEREEGPTEPPASDVSGVWELEAQTPRGPSDMKMDLRMKPDGRVSGDITGERGTRTLEKARMSGERLRFKTTATREGATFEVSWSFTVSGDEIEGTMKVRGFSMEIRGERTDTAQEAGADGDSAGPRVSLAELEEAMGHFWGPVEEHDVVAITNARVYTLAGETLESGTVVMSGGKIRAVGTDVGVPAGAEVIDAGGGSLIPGIIDAHSHIAIEGGGNEATLTVTSMVTIEDVINPDDVAIYRALAGGVTSINVLHGSANPIGGRNAVIKLRWGRRADGLRFAGAPPGIKFALGENPKRSRGFGPGIPRRFPATRMGVMDVIRQAFNEAREYLGEWEDYESAKKAGEKPIPPREDFKLRALAEILEGKRLVHSHCYRADEILQLLRLAEEFGFKVATLQHVLEGYKVADEIAAHGAGASTFSDWWGYKVEAYDAIPHNAAIMTRRGVVVSINSDSGEEMRHLNQEAAKAMRWGGLDEVEALKLVTLNPAIQLGIDDRAGSIEVGKDADLVLYDGPPLSMFSVVRKTFVDGKVYFDVDADRERQAVMDRVKAKLDGRSGGAGDSRATAGTRAEIWAVETGHGAGRRSRTDPTWGEHAYSCQEDH